MTPYQFKTAIVLPSKGIGDAILMMIASHHLLEKKCKVITYHPHLHELKRWFDSRHQLLPMSQPLEEILCSQIDLIIVQNDNSAQTQKLLELFKKEKLANLSIFYPSYSPLKHAPLNPLDQVFNPALTMVENIAISIASLLKEPLVSTNNGLKAPESLVHRKHKRQVAIHATSSDPKKNWSLKKYCTLALHLKKKLNYSSTFLFHHTETKETLLIKELELDYRIFKNLEDMATYIYESDFLIGNDSLLGHLASNLHIPTLTISDDKKRMDLWRPGWRKGLVITPPRWIPNFKWLRLRKNRWNSLISVRKVLSTFKKLHR